MYIYTRHFSIQNRFDSRRSGLKFLHKKYTDVFTVETNINAQVLTIEQSRRVSTSSQVQSSDFTLIVRPTSTRPRSHGSEKLWRNENDWSRGDDHFRSAGYFTFPGEFRNESTRFTRSVREDIRLLRRFPDYNRSFWDPGGGISRCLAGDAYICQAVKLMRAVIIAGGAETCGINRAGFRGNAWNRQQTRHRHGNAVSRL